jgi:Tfp pilus assembly protein PilV
MTRRHAHPNRRHGVSLIEALVALAVMAFGMLSLVGVQATMRLNSDLSKQRTEATRIATEELEGLRLFTSVPVASGQTSWDGIVSRTLSAYVPPGSIGNTSYRVERTVDLATTTQKVVTVKVSWVDRTGGTQSVVIDTLLVAAAPALSGLLAVPAMMTIFNSPGGRNATIPPEAVELDGSRSGSSALKPFDTGLVVWVFNDITGIITSRCSNVTAAQASIVVGDLTNCVSVNGRLVAGQVNFDLRFPLPAPPAYPAENPLGPALPLNASNPLEFLAVTGISPVNQRRAPECLANSPGTAAAGTLRTQVNYQCLVFPKDNSGWGGKLEVKLATEYSPTEPLPNDNLPGNYRVCRYTEALPSASDTGGDFIVNAKHPKSYCMEIAGTATAAAPCTGSKVTVNLTKQDFLVIDSRESSCPGDNPTTPLVNGNTRPHQP